MLINYENILVMDKPSEQSHSYSYREILQRRPSTKGAKINSDNFVYIALAIEKQLQYWSMPSLRCCLTFGLMFLFLHVGFSQSIKDHKKQAIRYFDSGRYYEAASAFEKYCSEKPGDTHASLMLARSQFEINQVDAAIGTISSLIFRKRSSPSRTLLLARCYHQKNLFEKAIVEYKKYLGEKEFKQDVPLRAIVVNQIKRCAVGLKHVNNSEVVLIENMGTKVNSIFDDFGPVESPNVEHRVYFSSLRSRHVMDDFDETSSLQSSSQRNDFDMFSTEITEGAWSAPDALNEDLNSSNHEILCDFSRDGSIAILQHGETVDDLHFYVDTFEAGAVSKDFSLWSPSPFDDDEDVKGVHLFADSIVFFASDRKDGYGGYDIYLSRKIEGHWSDAINLGPNINSAFDEITPFLSNDGRTLYFSNNGLMSMGGFDVFEASFDVDDLRWPKPKNLSRPINSAGDDLYYRLANNGLVAYYSSDRKSGQGGHDIYVAYFKNPNRAQLSYPVPSIYYEIKDFQLFSEVLVSGSSQANSKETKASSLAHFEMPHLLYGTDDLVMTAPNQVKLKKITGFLKTYPHLTLEILSHSDQQAVSNFDLFFSIKRAEEVADFIEKQGVKRSSILLKGYGGNYPYAKVRINGKENPSSGFFNRRIDFRIHRLDQLPIEVNYLMPTIHEALLDGSLSTFYNSRKGLYYRVEFTALDQLFKGDLVGRYPDSCIEKNPLSTQYHYSSGIFRTFESALKHFGEIKKEGFSESQIIPYLDGVRMRSNEISQEILSKYPDLENFILYLN